MQDTCAEYMVKHRNSVFDIIFQFLLVILAAALVGIVVIFVKGIGALLAVLIIHLKYYELHTRHPCRYALSLSYNPNSLQSSLQKT